MKKDEIVTKEYLDKSLKDLVRSLNYPTRGELKKIVKEAIHEEFNGTLFSIRPVGKVK